MRNLSVISFVFTLCVAPTQNTLVAQNFNKDSLENLVKNAPADNNRVNLLVNLSNELISLDLIKSQQYAEEALELSKKNNYKKGEASILLTFSEINRRKGNFYESFNKSSEALLIFQQINDTQGQANSYFESGYLYKDIGSHEKSLEKFKTAYNINKKIGNNIEAAMCLMIMGHVNADKAAKLKDTTYLRNALNLYNRSLAYFKKANNKKNISTILSNISNAYLAYNRLTPSVSYINKSIAISNQSLQIADSLKNNRKIWNNLLNIAEAYYALKEYDKALKYSQKAYEIAQNNNLTDGELQAIGQILLIYKETGKFNNALHLSPIFLKIAKKNNYRRDIRNHYKIISEVYSDKQDYAKAYTTRLIYESYADSILNEEKAKTLIKSQIEFESKLKDKEISLLNKNQELQQIKLKQQQTIRNYLMGAIVLTLLLLFVIYNRFKFSIKTNRIIIQKNKELEKLSIVAREIANGVLITDEDGNIEWFNEGFSKLFGWINIDEYIQKRGQNISKVSGLENIKDVIKQCVNNKKSITYEALNPSREGNQLWIQTTVTPIFDKAGILKKLVFVDADITELKKSETRYANVNKELEAFSYSVSHDLRAPLRAISGYSQILKEDYESKIDTDGINALNAILNNSKRMGQLIDDLLTFSRLGRNELHIASVDMNQLVKTILDDSIEKGGKEVEIKLTNLPTIKASQTLITQVWINLISNAYKFSLNKDKPKIEIGAYDENDSVVYFVKDNGAGFDMQYYEKLFGVFQRLHSQEEFEGTGIGLAIVQKIIQRHNGKVWAESKLNEGSCFYFSLPKIIT